MNALTFIKNPYFSDLPLQEGIERGVWYVVCKSWNEGDTSNRNESAMGSKLWCFHVDYKPNGQNGHKALLAKYTLDALRCKQVFRELYFEGKKGNIASIMRFEYWLKQFSNYDGSILDEEDVIGVEITLF